MLGKFMNFTCKWIWSCGKLNFYAHHNQFDVIRPANGYGITQVRKCYLISLVLYILGGLYGIFGLECESRPSCVIEWASLPTSPYNYYHQMSPKAIWSQVNVLALSVLCQAIGSWIGFLTNPPIETRFLIHLNAKSKEKKDQLAQMCTFRDSFLKFTLVMEMAVYLSGMTFVYVHVFGINANYNLSLTSVLFWGLLNPMHLYYVILFLYTVPLYVILTSRYITIQQKALTNKLIDLNGKLNNIRNQKGTLRRAILWRQYISVNTQICDLCKHMREYARFWSLFLTMLFMAFISFQCYVFYVYLFASGLPSTLRYMLLFFVFGIVFTEFVLITLCASVVKHFKAITAQNRAFYLCYRSTSGVGKVLPRNLLKAENLQDSQLLRSYAFRLYGNYRITNKSFHIIISYISIFFLFIVKNKH